MLFLTPILDNLLLVVCQLNVFRQKIRKSEVGHPGSDMMAVHDYQGLVRPVKEHHPMQIGTGEKLHKVLFQKAVQLAAFLTGKKV